MSDPTRPVRRVRRPQLSKPADSAESQAQAQDDAAERAAIQAESREAEEEAARSRASAPPATATRSEIRREGHARPVSPGFEPRDGDVLVVTYPEVTLPLPRQYSMMKFGGGIYTRQLRAGDDVDAELSAITTWLSARMEAEGAAKYRRMVAQFVSKKAAE